jgi:hypothetical protein
MCLKGWAPPELNPKMSREKISRNAPFRFDASDAARTSIPLPGSNRHML